MSTSTATRLKPPKKRIKNLVAKVSMISLGRSFQVASALDQTIQEEIRAWPEGFTIVMKVMPGGPCMVMTKIGERMKYMGGKEREADLLVMFKNLESALLVLTAQMGTPQAFAECRVSVKGNLTDAMIMTRCLNVTQAYLMPKFMGKKIMKRVPGIPFGQLIKNRAIIYTVGVPFGKP